MTFLPAVVCGAWFSALPPYIKARPLWSYALEGKSAYDLYNHGRDIFHCPTALAQPTDPSLTANADRVIFQYGMNSKGIWEQKGTVQVSPLKTTIVKIHIITHVRFHACPQCRPAW